MSAANDNGAWTPPKGADDSHAVELGEAYWRGAPYRLVVRIGDEHVHLTLRGARQLARRMEGVVKRLAKRRASRAHK